MTARKERHTSSPSPFTVDPDIRTASTPPSEVYHDPAYFDHQKDTVFARAWHLVGDASKRDDGAGVGLDRVELEDEEIVEQVQRGMEARLYDRGR